MSFVLNSAVFFNTIVLFYRMTRQHFVMCSKKAIPSCGDTSSWQKLFIFYVSIKIVINEIFNTCLAHLNIFSYKLNKKAIPSKMYIYTNNIILYPPIFIITVVASIHTETFPFTLYHALMWRHFDDASTVNLIGGMSRDVAMLFKRNRPSATFIHIFFFLISNTCTTNACVVSITHTRSQNIYVVGHSYNYFSNKSSIQWNILPIHMQQSHKHTNIFFRFRKVLWYSDGRVFLMRLTVPYILGKVVFTTKKKQQSYDCILLYTTNICSHNK